MMMAEVIPRYLDNDMIPLLHESFILPISETRDISKEIGGSVPGAKKLLWEARERGFASIQ